MPPVSVSTPLFIKNTEELIERLEAFATPEAKALLPEARALLAEFRRWEHHKPPDDIRSENIRAVFALQRRVLDLVTRGSSPQGT